MAEEGPVGTRKVNLQALRTLFALAG